MQTVNTFFLAYFVVINLITIFLFGADKISSASGAWRVRERTLLVLALIGGSPGALTAMKLFRHKTVKPSFQLLMTMVLVAQLVVGWLVWNRFFPHTNLPLTDTLHTL